MAALQITHRDLDPTSRCAVRGGVAKARLLITRAHWRRSGRDHGLKLSKAPDQEYASSVDWKERKTRLGFLN